MLIPTIPRSWPYFHTIYRLLFITFIRKYCTPTDGEKRLIILPLHLINSAYYIPHTSQPPHNVRIIHSVLTFLFKFLLGLRKNLNRFAVILVHHHSIPVDNEKITIIFVFNIFVVLKTLNKNFADVTKFKRQIYVVEAQAVDNCRQILDKICMIEHNIILYHFTDIMWDSGNNLVTMFMASLTYLLPSGMLLLYKL